MAGERANGYLTARCRSRGTTDVSEAAESSRDRSRSRAGGYVKGGASLIAAATC